MRTCERHGSTDRECVDCLIESMYHITILSIRDIMTSGPLNQWKD